MKLHGYQPEQLNVVNPIEILVLVPLFEKVIYPHLESHNFRITHVRRMAVGMLLTSISFVVSGILESAIEAREEAGEEKISVFWQLPRKLLHVTMHCVRVWRFWSEAHITVSFDISFPSKFLLSFNCFRRNNNIGMCRDLSECDGA